MSPLHIDKLMDKKSKIYIAGSSGLVGSAIIRKLKKAGYSNLLTKTRKELDLMDEKAVSKFFNKEKPEYVFLCAAKVGGIKPNYTYPADFIYENIQIESNVIHEAYKNKVKKLLFLGCICMYPRESKQPMKEEYFLTGPLEPTAEPYSIAKIAGVKMCQSYNKQYGTNFISVMPANLYGPEDNYDLETSHALPAFIHRFDDARTEKAREITLWGTGSPQRDFMFVDDCAEACIFLMKHYNEGEIINIGTGVGTTIKNLSKILKKVIGFNGKLKWDKTKPNGAPKRILDTNKLTKLGWKSRTKLESGLQTTYKWYIDNKK